MVRVSIDSHIVSFLEAHLKPDLSCVNSQSPSLCPCYVGGLILIYYRLAGSSRL